MGRICWFLLNFNWSYHERINSPGWLLNHALAVYHFVDFFDGCFLLFFLRFLMLSLISFTSFDQGLYLCFQLVGLDKFVFSIFWSMDKLLTVLQVNLNLTVVFHPCIVNQSLILFFKLTHLENEIKKSFDWFFDP